MEKIMSYAAHHKEFASYSSAPQSRDAAPHHVGLLRRVFDAIFESRQRHADQEIARFIASSGGHLTDDVERRMMQRLNTPSFGASQ
jgi:hypothetical protein